MHLSGALCASGGRRRKNWDAIICILVHKLKLIMDEHVNLPCVLLLGVRCDHSGQAL